MLATITGTGDGSAPVVNLTFPFIDKTHVKASVDGVVVAATWTGASQITFASPVPVGSAWKVYRETPTNPAVVDFTNGAVLTEADLDLAETSHRYRDEELSDLVVTAQTDADAATTAADAATTAATAATGAVDALQTSITGIPNATAHASSRAALALLGQTAPAYLAEAHREGMFVFDGADHSADVTADPAQGFYVAPQSDVTGASGAWVRLIKSPINPTWFGVVEGDDPANGAGNSAAFANLLATVEATKVFHVRFPAGTFWLSSTTDLNAGNLILEGPGGAGVEDPNAPIAATLKFAPGATGIRVQGPNTSGADVKDAAAHSSGLGTVLRNLVLVGGFSGTEGEAHGIQLRWPATIEDVTIRDFEGDGIHIAADGLAATGANPPYGNANRSSIIRPSIYNCRDGLFFDGGDANACIVVMADVNACRRWGINDSSGLGNSFVGGQLSTNGSSSWNDGTAGHPAAMVSQAGNRYGAIIGQEAWCSTNAPSGTTADNQGWYYIGPGAPDVGIPAWVNGMDVRAGGHAHDDSAAATSYYSGIYAEGGFAKAQLTNPSIVVGGKLAEALFQNNASPATGQVSYAKGATYGPASSGITYEIGPSLQVKSGAVYAALGAPQGNPDSVGLNLFHPTYAQFGYRLFFDSAHDGDLSFGYDGSIPAFRVTSPTTTQQFGTGVVQPDVFSPASLAVAGNFKDYTAAKRLMIDFQAPTSGDHSQGEWAFYWGGLTDFIGWHCVTAGNPGDWRGVWGLTAAKPGGWTAWTGVGSKATKDVSTATTADVAAGLKSLIDDLMARGVI